MVSLFNIMVITNSTIYCLCVSAAGHLPIAFCPPSRFVLSGIPLLFTDWSLQRKMALSA